MYNKEFWKWVDEHRDENPSKLWLKMHGKGSWVHDAIMQIENERRSHKKFATDCDDITSAMPRLMPVGISIEQATSAKVAQLHRAIAKKFLPKKSSILDMTCGLGVDASILATISGAYVTCIELNEKIAEIASYNYGNRGNITVINADSVSYLHTTDKHFNLIFIDPARRDNSGNKVYNIHDCTPDVTDIMPIILDKSDHVMIKLSPMLDITQTIRDLPSLQELYIIDEGGECRELLAVAGRYNTGEPVIHAIDDTHDFTFTRSEEAAVCFKDYALPTCGLYLFEPAPGLLKAGAFKLIAQRFGIIAIHPNTHVYVGNAPIPDFFGRQSIIKDVLKFSSTTLKSMKKERIEGDVAVRNFPITADTLRAKLGIKKSGKERIVGITACDGKQYLLRVGPCPTYDM